MGLQSKMSEWVSGFEEKEGVMRNAMTTRAPCGAKNTCLMKKLKAIWEPQKYCLTIVLGCFALIISY